MNLRRTRAMASKELRHIWRDARSLIIALALPVIMLLLFGYALSLDVDHIPTLIFDSDGSPESRALIARFEGSRYFEILGFVDDYRTIERSIDREECLIAVVIPKEFSRNLLTGKEVQVQLIIDGSDSNTASIALGYAEALVANHALALQSAQEGGTQAPLPVEARLRVWYNSDLKSQNYIVPGLLAVILMIISALLTSLTIAREWEMGTMEQLLSTPLRPAELVLGKMSAYFAVGAIDTVIVIVVGVLIFEVPLRGSLFFLAVSCFIFLFGALCWGILISAIAGSQLLAYQLGMMTSFLPAFLLSGFIYSIENMPAPIQMFTFLVPARYFITLLKGIFLKGIGFELLALEVAFLTAFATLVFLTATRMVKRTVV
ncbi:MAG: ABC transporter permease [Acidobacteria bacterium]|nr:ABC transporter permease [Acidobacteriota bacterium]